MKVSAGESEMVGEEYVKAGVEGGVEGFINGTAHVAEEVYKKIRDSFKEKRRIKEAVERTNKLFKNPKSPWRSVRRTTKELYPELAGEPGIYAATRLFLKDYLYARPDHTPNSKRDPNKGEDVWIVPANWKWNPAPPGNIDKVLCRDASGHAIPSK
jgi:hypothetical protein